MVSSRGLSEIPWDVLCAQKPSCNPGSAQSKKGGPSSEAAGNPASGGRKAFQDELMGTVGLLTERGWDSCFNKRVTIILVFEFGLFPRQGLEST